MRDGQIYMITVISDGFTTSDHYYNHAIEAVEAWNKFVDIGEAKEIRTVTFLPPTGEPRNKSFYAKQALR